MNLTFVGLAIAAVVIRRDDHGLDPLNQDNFPARDH